VRQIIHDNPENDLSHDILDSKDNGKAFANMTFDYQGAVL
jgi:hypothetical protein